MHEHNSAAEKNNMKPISSSDTPTSHRRLSERKVLDQNFSSLTTFFFFAQVIQSSLSSKSSLNALTKIP